jgi:cyanophycinase
MAARLLFLLGGSAHPVLDLVAQAFVPAAGGREARIALLLLGGSGWEKYVPQYAEPWERQGATRHSVVVPNDEGVLDVGTASTAIREATGIFIGGGNTTVYRQLYATEPIRSLIRERYARGIPIAGLSAGAIIAPQRCAAERDPCDDASVTIEEGIGLIDGLVVVPHYTERSRTPRLLEAMAQARIASGLGIDEAACVVIEDGKVAGVLGESAYWVEMTDFDTGAHSVRRL